jgi:hypothetical protein
MKKNKLLFLLIPLLLASCSKPSYCKCEDVSREAITASIGLQSDLDLDDLDDCAEKVKEDLDFSMPADKIGVDFIQQVSYEMCKYGYYEGKGSDNRGKKYYPSSE